MTPRTLRAALLLAGLGFILFGPAWVQLFGGRLTPLTRSWRMYKKAGLQTCEAVFERHHPDGRVERLDRFAVLDLPPPHNAQRRFRLGDVAQIRHHGRDLCRALDGGRTDIRIHARCPTSRGWRPVFAGEENVCH